MTIINGYVTLAEAKERLLTTGATDTSDDTQIEAVINAASRQVDADTGRKFYTTAADETRIYQAEWNDILYTDDIVSVTTLKTDEDGDGVYETTWTAGTDYILMPTNAALGGYPYTSILTAPDGNYSFEGNVEIVGKFGRANTTAVDTRTFTAPLTSIAYVDNLASITTLKTDGDGNGSYETTWTVTTDYIATAVPNTPTTLLVVSGAKTFPTAADGVQIVGTWNLTGAPDSIKEATLLQCLIMFQTKNLFGGMGKMLETLDEMNKQYQRLIQPFKRLV